MVSQRVIQFEYQQSLAHESDKNGWSDDLTISVRILSEAITSSWYRDKFSSRGNDFVILIAIAMHSRPLKGEDLELFVRLGMATPADEGRLYARVSDIGLAAELGMSRDTIARATARLAEEQSISILTIPEEVISFRDSHGQFSGSKVYVLAGDLQNRFLDKTIQDSDRAANYGAAKSSTVNENQAHRAAKSRTVEGKNQPHRAANSSTYAANLGTNIDDEEEEEEERTARIFRYFASKKGLAGEYTPTQKEKAALEKLLGDGFSEEGILKAIDAAFEESRPNYFTLCAIIARRVRAANPETRQPEPRTNPETRIPAARTQPEAEQPEPRTNPESRRAKTRSQPVSEPLIIEPALARATEVYKSPERDLTADTLARFRQMAARCDQKARESGSSGAEWLADALSAGLGVAQPASLLNYASRVLEDWIQNGRNGPVEKKSASPSKRRSDAPAEPKGYAGLRQYLKNRGAKPPEEAPEEE